MAAKSDEDTITNERPIKCVITGDGFTGKTTLAMKLQDPEVDVTTLKYIPAQYDEFRRKVTVENGNEVEVSVWDTAENEECRRLMQLNYIMADVFILTYKLTHPHSIENIQSEWAKLVRHMVPGAPIIIVGTHCDRNLDSAEGTDVKARLAEVAENVVADKCLEVSAKYGTNVEKLLRDAVELGLVFRKKKEGKKKEGKKKEGKKKEGEKKEGEKKEGNKRSRRCAVL